MAPSQLGDNTIAIIHHGGNGMTTETCQCGIYSIVKPFFGDQFQNGKRIEDLGVGIVIDKWENLHPKNI